MDLTWGDLAYHRASLKGLQTAMQKVRGWVRRSRWLGINGVHNSWHIQRSIEAHQEDHRHRIPVVVVTLNTPCGKLFPAGIEPLCPTTDYPTSCPTLTHSGATVVLQHRRHSGPRDPGPTYGQARRDGLEGARRGVRHQSGAEGVSDGGIHWGVSLSVPYMGILHKRV